jgi:hypothetical protein
MLSLKLEDLVKFIIPCILMKVTIKKTHCDLRTSVNLMSCIIFEQMNIGELKSTKMTI